MNISYVHYFNSTIFYGFALSNYANFAMFFSIYLTRLASLRLRNSPAYVALFVEIISVLTKKSISSAYYLFLHFRMYMDWFMK